MRDEIILSVTRRMNARLQERQGSAGCIVKCDRVSIASEHARSSPLFRYKTGSASPIVNGTMRWIIARNMRSPLFPGSNWAEGSLVRCLTRSSFGGRIRFVAERRVVSRRFFSDIAIGMRSIL